jgi:hypothetical protein
MTGRRVDDGLDRGQPFQFLVDGEAITAYPGESIAAALIAHGRNAARRTAKTEAPRGYFCGMGVCWDCAMTVDGTPNVRTCRAEARPNMRVRTQRGVGAVS